MSQIAEIAVLSLEQKRELVAKLLRQKAAARRDVSSLVHRQIELQAARIPEAIALTCGGESLTYSELNARANRLARRLRAMGVGPDVLVGLCVGRSSDMVVGILAVLKAGGAYVPLDPAYPADRLAFMLDDSCAPVLITEERLRGDLPDCATRVLCLDSERGVIDTFSDANLDGEPDASNLAYVIYTSGSTGKPKGVQVTHGAIANLLESMRHLLHFSERDALLAVTTLSFDIAALEIFLPLIVGARVEVIDRDVAADGARLAERLGDPRITFLQATPATWRLLLEGGWPGKPALTMLCGGEALPRVLADRLIDKGRALWNVYGPTETTVWSSAWRVEAGEAAISIGSAIANTQLYVLDARLRAVPVGVVGELYIGGAGLARGYRNRPGLTAERFIPDPFGRPEGGRLYRTGDLARWRRDGSLECLGRIDHQVKVRGFRIELGEIEAALARHPAVREAAVSARPDPSGEMSLIAYIAQRDRPDPGIAADLRRWLMGAIPEYMIPGAFVFLDALPLTPNGKIDRQALPDPDRTHASASAGFVPPCGPIEETLAEIWSELLGGERVGAHDNFFERGGHSLLAVQLLSRLRQTFGVEGSLRDFLEDPTISRLARIVKQALEDGTAPSAPPLVPVKRGSPLPASFAQQRLWFLDQLQPGLASYHIPAAVKLVGRLDVPALERALNEVVRRHESLRITLVANDGIPYQVIAKQLLLALTIQDLSGCPPDEREIHAENQIRAEAERPFDLARGPLVRAALLRLSDQEHIAMVTMHHAVSDGWSIGILIRELSALYQSCVLDQPSPLPEPAIQYADYAVWHRAWLEGPVLDAQLAYWTRQLAGVPDLELPTDRPRPATANQRGGDRSTIIPKSILEAVRAVGRREGATLYMTLLAAFQVLLGRYSGQEDFAVGTPIAGRSRPELEGLIGFFVNTLVVRADLSGDPGFRELLRRIRATAIEAFTHQEIPFDKLVSALHRDRDSSRSPIFQVMFALQNVPTATLQAPELLLDPIELSSATSKFDLTLFATEVPEGLRLTMEYSTDLYDAATIDRLLGNFQALLEGITADPARPLSELPLLTETDRNQLLVEWNATRVDYPRNALLHELFQDQVARTPHAVALSFGSDRLSYRALNGRANQLAHRLRSLGVGPEVRVGLYAERSLEMVVGLLGILKAGGAYVPLDPSYPMERVAYMLEDARVPVLLTQARLSGSLPSHGAHVICLDSEWDTIAGESNQNLAGETAPENLAYVIYTSGSTGRPKGAMNTHRAICNRLLWMQDAYRLDADDRVLQKTPFSFDVSVWEFFWPLICGASLIVAPPGVHKDSAALISLIVDEKITTLHFVPSMLAAFLMETGVEACHGLKRVICSGEALPFEYQERFFARLGTELHNLYGPTEAAVDVTAWACERGGQRPIVPIGRPIANTQIYVLDAKLGPVPVGMPGELHIGGVGLARGYHDRPGLTAEKFIPDPFSRELGARMYKTGDLARHRPDGAIEFLGRLDYQVKIRGFRIELGEVEAALGQHPALCEVVVLAREDTPGNHRLVAYLVALPSDAPPPAARALRQWLLTRLPEYMIPSAYVMLEVLPLTPNGKVDRKALPAPEVGRAEADAPFVSPRGPVEEKVASVWETVLGLTRVGADDNFFDLGGHSLLATQVVSQLRSAFEVQIALRELFEAPTVAGLAERIEAMRHGGARREATPIEPARSNGPLPLSFSQEALWFLDQLAPGQPTFNVTAALRVKGPLDRAAFERSLNELVRRHASLRTSFLASGGTPRQVVETGVSLSLETADLTDLPLEHQEIEARRQAIEASRRPFDLTRGPLARASLLQLGERDHAVVLTMHHLITDGWSFGVAAAELAAFYEADRLGRPSPLPDSPIQYADFAQWQRGQLESGAWSAQIESWRRRLAGVPALELPTDRPRPPIRTARGALHQLVLTRELSAAVRAAARREGVTPFMTLLAAYQLLLGRWSGQEDFAVGAPVANRGRPETERMIGYFVNMIALRANLAGNPTAREFLARVREVALEAFENQEVPLEVLVPAIAPRRDASRSPLFQVMFVLQNNALPATDPVDLVFSPLDLDQGTGTSKFDLSLGFDDNPDGFTGSVEFNTDLFDPATIEQFSSQYVKLLEDLIAYPERRLSELSLLTDTERRRVAAWSHVPSQSSEHVDIGDRDAFSAIHDVFLAQVRATPDALALVAGDARLTYAELNARANRLAHYLVARGAGPEVGVGLYIEGLVDQIVTVLAVLKAGGAYVPLDPSLPPARMEAMMIAASVSIVIADRRSLERTPRTTATVIELEAARADIAAESPEDLPARTESANLAYIIFTSGSTGQPKGVMVSHASLVATAAAWEQSYDLRRPPLRHLQAAGFAFDVFTGDWVRALTTGGTLVACPRPFLLDPAALADLVRRERIECLELVPAVADALATHLERRGEDLEGIRLLAVGSDTVRGRLYRRLCRLIGPGGRVVNSYGLTEATIDSTYWGGPLEDLEAEDGPVPIGRPLPGTRTYILDGSGEPAPVGVVGELYIGGSGVARGYVSSPRLTAERFVPDPLADPGSRMYATGDRARWREGGVLELLGRRDGQLKVRGFRVELAEVEAAIGSWPGVRETAVVAQDDGADGQRLIACIVNEQERSLDVEALRRFLRDRLPRPMIPSQFQIVESLPRTHSGKVDRRRLSESLPDQVARVEAIIRPRDVVEEQLVAIWEDLIPIRPIGVTDDFFDLGGHSLLAVRLAARIEERFGRSLVLSDLLLGSTIEELAALIRAPVASRQGSTLIDLGVSGPGRPLFLVHPIGGGVLCYHDLARCLSGARAVLGFQAAGFDGEAEPETSIERMASRYVEALRAAHPDGPYVLGGWSMGGIVAFEMAAQLAAAGVDVPPVFLIDCSVPVPRSGPRLFDELEGLVGFASDLARTSGRESQTWIDRLRGLDPASIGNGTFDQTVIGRQIAGEIGADRLRRLQSVFRANRLALDGYQPRPYPGRVILIQAESSRAELDRLSTGGWNALALGGVTTHQLPGDHYSIMQRPSVGRLAEILASEMELHERTLGEVSLR